MDMILDYIRELFTTLIAQPLEYIYNNLASWMTGLTAVLCDASNNIEGGETDNVTASAGVGSYIYGSNLFKAFVLIGILLLALLVSVSCLGPIGVLTSLITAAILDILIAGEWSGSAVSFSGIGNVMMWVWETVTDCLGLNSDLAVGMAATMGATIGTISWFAELTTAAYLGEVTGFAFSCIGAFISWYGCTVTDKEWGLELGIIGTGLSALGLILTLKDKNLKTASPIGYEIMNGISIMDVGISIFGVVTTVANYDE
ncbi:MAG: hypothetical protein WC375_08350 [Methanomassiliicoccales archaeon]